MGMPEYVPAEPRQLQLHANAPQMAFAQVPLVQWRTVGTGEHQVLLAVVGWAALQFTQGGHHGGAQRHVAAPSIGLHRAELPAVVVLANSQAAGRQNLTADDD